MLGHDYSFGASPVLVARVAFFCAALRCVAFILRSFSSCLHLEAASFSLCFEPFFSCCPFLSSDSILSMHLLDARTDCPHAMLASNDHVLRRATLVSISRHSSALQSSGCSLFLFSSVVSVRFVALLFALTSCSLFPSIPLYHWPRSIASRSATASSSCSDELQIYCHWTLAFRHLTDLFHFLSSSSSTDTLKKQTSKIIFSRNCSLSYIMCLDPLPVASISHNSGTVCAASVVIIVH